MTRIDIPHVSRIEGHASITIDLDEAGRVANTQFHVTQIRGFEKFVEGRPYYEMPSITARICGICPVAYQMSTIHALEAIFGVEASPAVRALRPDFAVLAGLDCLGVIATAPGDEADFVSRFFGPAVGIDEDPVTGSAHCCLGPFWAERLGATTLTGYQASARGGVVRLRVGQERVILLGQAVTVLRATLRA